MKTLIAFLCAALFAAQALAAPEDVIRAKLKERLSNLPAIDEIRKTPMPGLYEVRINRSEILYTDATGRFMLQGDLIDLQTLDNLTERRVEQLNAVPFDDLPLKDAITIVRGKGERRMAVFADPNCGYCKRYEKELALLDNVKIYLFLYPILGADSQEKSQNIWCAKDKGKTWDDWMLRGVRPPAAKCDTAAVARNVAFGRTYRISGTPTTFMPNGARLSGLRSLDDIEKALVAR